MAIQVDMQVGQDMGETPLEDTLVDVWIPPFDARTGAGVRRAYADALAREIEAAGCELADAGVTSLNLHGAGHLGEEGLAHVLAAARRALPDLAGMAKVAYLEPTLMSTSLMTPLRNCGFDLYDIDLGSLDPIEFRGLSRGYAYETYELTKRLLDAYELREWRAAGALGMPGQTARTFAAGLDRLLAWGPAAVRLDVARVAGDATDAAGRPGTQGEALPADLATRANAAAELLAQADGTLSAHGYARCGALEWSLPAYARYAETGLANLTWGFGLGATSYLDGCLVRNTGDLARYLAACGVVPAVGANEAGSAGEAGATGAEAGTGGVFESVARLDDASLARLDVYRALATTCGFDRVLLKETPGASALAPALDRLRDLDLLADNTAARGARVDLTPRGVVLLPLVRRILDEP